MMSVSGPVAQESIGPAASHRRRLTHEIHPTSVRRSSFRPRATRLLVWQAWAESAGLREDSLPNGITANIPIFAQATANRPQRASQAAISPCINSDLVREWNRLDNFRREPREPAITPGLSSIQSKRLSPTA